MNFGAPGTIFGREPVAIYAFINAVIICAVTFGLQLDANQIGSILTVVNVGLALITRTSVVSPETASKAVKEALRTPTTAAKAVEHDGKFNGVIIGK